MTLLIRVNMRASRGLQLVVAAPTPLTVEARNMVAPPPLTQSGGGGGGGGGTAPPPPSGGGGGNPDPCNGQPCPPCPCCPIRCE